MAHRRHAPGIRAANVGHTCPDPASPPWVRPRLLGERLVVAHTVGGRTVAVGVDLVSRHDLANTSAASTTWIGDLIDVVPAISILIGIPLVDEIPDGTQLAGLALVSAALSTAVGIAGRFGSRLFSLPARPIPKPC